jgi:DNA-binding transcriptional LysR family regulator
VRLRIGQVDAPADVRNAVRSGQAELGLTDELHATDRDLTGELLAEQEMVAVLPPGHPAPRDGVMPLPALLETNLVAGPPGSMMRDFLTREAARLGQEFSPVVEVAPRGSTLYFAMTGAGVTLLPRPMAELARPPNATITSLDPRQWRRVYLLRRAASLSPAARAMRALLREPDTGGVTRGEPEGAWSAGPG